MTKFKGSRRERRERGRRTRSFLEMGMIAGIYVIKLRAPGGKWLCGDARTGSESCERGRAQIDVDWDLVCYHSRQRLVKQL